MTESSLLRQIREANKSFLLGSPRYLDSAGDPFVVVACIDPRLTGFLEPALGLPRHRAVVIRTAGNQLSERTRDELRSIAVALFVKKAREILIVGHTDCGMSTFSAADAAEAFRKAGVARSAFGDDDLRNWFGAYGSIRENVLGSAAFLRKSAVVPQDVKIHGLILDTDKGVLDVIVDGDVVLAAPLASAPVTAADVEVSKTGPVETEDSAALPAAPSSSHAAPQIKKGPIVVGEPRPKLEPTAAPPSSLLDAALVLREFLNKERQNQQMQKTILDLKALWKKEKDPLIVYAALQRAAQAYEKQYPRLPGALRYLEDAIRSGHADKIGLGEILKRILD